MFSNYDEILTVADVCDILYIGRNTAYALLSEGKVRGFQIGRTWKSRGKVWKRIFPASAGKTAYHDPK